MPANPAPATHQSEPELQPQRELQPQPQPRHTVAVLAPDGVVGFDLAIPCQVFSATWAPDRSLLYEVKVCGSQAGVRVTANGVHVYDLVPPHALDEAITADTVVVPGVTRPTEPRFAETLEVLRAAEARGARIASICTGAFILAAAGLLDHRRATTHWAHADDLAAHHPAVDVDPSVLFIDEGRVVTSAGVAAGLDLCLHLVRRDHGAAIAAATARRVVMPAQREGGQAQFIAYEDPDDGTSALEPVMHWMRENLRDPLTLADVAARAVMSPRTLNRRFRDQTGTTPLQWLIRQRLIRARILLETTGLPVEEVAAEAGFGSAIALRQHFARAVNTSPVAYRKAFRADIPADPRPQ